MLSINTNLSSLIVQNSMKQSTNRLNTAIERLTTGFKINHAKDNAANYNITTNMTTKIGAYMVAEDNCAMGLDLLATANGSLEQIADKLQRLRALAVQTSNGTYGEKSKEAINQEANAIVDEIERIYNTTEYNGINLMKGQVTGVEESKFIKDIDRRDTSRMTTLASVDETKALTSGTYSISTPEELAKLATMTNNGLIGAGTEFVLGNDIDLQEWCDAHSATGGWVPIGSYVSKFSADFDGNGYKIRNTAINRVDRFQGLFGVVTDCTISNIAVVNLNYTAGYTTAGLIAQIEGISNIHNCYTTGVINSSDDNVGGLGGYVVPSSMVSIQDSYSECSVSGKDWCGGLLGDSKALIVENCFATGDVTGQRCVGGFAGSIKNKIINSYSLGDVEGSTRCGLFTGQMNAGNMEDCYSSGSFVDGSSPVFVGILYNDPIVLNSAVVSEQSLIPLKTTGDGIITNRRSYLDLQIGVNSDSNSLLVVDLEQGFNLLNQVFRVNLLAEQDQNLEIIDSLLEVVSSQQLKFGASQNRLESALDEISVQYENLVSSRSTLRDTDISEVSSEYIRQQILQQASATLLSTANQSPSIALQLI